MKLSGVREDTHFLRTIGQIPTFGKRDALACAVAPLILYPTPSAEFNSWFDGKSFTEDDILTALSTMPTVFTYHNEYASNGMQSSGYVGVNDAKVDIRAYYRVTQNPDGTVFTEDGTIESPIRIRVELFRVSFKESGLASTLKFIVSLGYSVNEIRPMLIEVKYLYASGKLLTDRDEMQSMLTQNGKRVDPDIWLEAAAETAEIALADIASMCIWANEHDQYPVIQQSTKPAQKGTKPCKRRDLPRLIYMNKLPSAHSQSLGGHHASPRGHERRGHYKTLRHEKYKHHPKYGVEKGIYVRPAWVGDKTVVHEGNRYTVIT